MPVNYLLHSLIAECAAFLFLFTLYEQFNKYLLNKKLFAAAGIYFEYLFFLKKSLSNGAN